MLDRKLKISVGAIIAAMLSFTILPGQAGNLFIQEKDSCRDILLAEALVEYPFGWFYTLDEIEEIYEVEYYESHRLESFVKNENGKCINQCNNELSEIPGQFIETTLKLLQQILDRELTEYLFRLDTFHGHFFVTDRQFEKKYLDLNTEEMMKEFVNDDSLGVLIHCAEHLALRKPPRTGDIDKKARELIKQRNIIGWYDTESIEVVTAPKKELIGIGKANTARIPHGFRGVGAITFKANINGEFNIEHGDQTLRLDISLCDYYYH
jgi:hypothetical protein